MRTNTLTINESVAVEDIMRPIFEGRFDFSNKEKFFYFFVAPITAAYASWESVKFYMDIGGKGTKYLPIGNFSKEFGGQAAFWSNFSFNWFYMMDTLFAVRKAYLQYKHAKELGITTSMWKTAIKLFIGFILALASGTVMALVAGNSHGLYNQVETGLVNTLLNYLGSIALETVIVIIVSKIKDYLFKRFCQAAGLDNDDIELSPTLLESNSSSWLGDHLSDKADDFGKIKKGDSRWTDLNTFSGYMAFALASGERTQLLRSGAKQASGWPEWIISGFFHIALQVCDKISLYGYWKDTMKQTMPTFKMKNQGTANVIGTAIFIPFVSLTSKVTYDTVVEIKEMTKSAFKGMKNFYQNPDWSKETFIKMAGISVVAALAFVGYFFAYVSSNSGLELNAEYGWEQPWNVYPSAVGTSVFNGFGFLGILLVLYSLTMPHLVQSAEQKNVTHRHHQITDFFNAYPKAVEELASQESIGFPALRVGIIDV